MTDAPADTITLTHRNRMLSPLLTCAICTLMFGPLIATTFILGPTGKTIAGASIMAICIAWCGVSALRAPYAMTIQGDAVRIRRLRGEQTHPLSDVRDWFFSVPEGRPVRTAPTTNALFKLKLADRTRFRAEVTAEEAAQLVAVLPPR